MSDLSPNDRNLFSFLPLPSNLQLHIPCLIPTSTSATTLLDFRLCSLSSLVKAKISLESAEKSGQVHNVFIEDPNEIASCFNPMTGTETEQPRTVSRVVFKDQIFFLLKVKPDITSWALGI